MHVLLVDDDKLFLDKLKKLLLLDNYKVETAISGEEALKLVDKKEVFDIILTDLKMPGISGLELIKKLKEKKVESVIIMITGYGTVESAVDAMKHGAYDYILKPFEFIDLRNKIKQAEVDINLRRNLPNNKVVRNSVVNGKIEKIDFKEYTSPYLLISNTDPKKIAKKYGLNNVSSIWINNLGEDLEIKDITLFSIKSKIRDFVDDNDKGTIIINGIEDILQVFEWEDLKKNLSYMMAEILTKNFSLVILIREKSDFLNISEQTLLQNTLSLLVNPIFNKIINLLSHPLRKDIISLLKAEKALNFNKIVKKLNVKRSSVLAFHINKLVQEDIVKKEENLYQLSNIGFYFVEIILLLENLGLAYPKSQIKLYKIPN